MSRVSGRIDCLARLSGNPQLILSFISPPALNSCSLHKCVSISKFKKDKTLSFVPADGKSTILKYTVPIESNKIPLLIRSFIKNGVFEIQLRSIYPVEDVRVLCILPPNTFSITSTLSGTSSIKNTHFDSSLKQLKWTVGKLDGIVKLSAQLNSTKAEKRVNCNVLVSFRSARIVSSVAIDGLKVFGESYTPYKGVRTLCLSGTFEERCEVYNI